MEGVPEQYLNLGVYDFGMRMLDVRLCRWLSVDSYFKDYPGFSNYLYSAANPIRFKDTDGNKVVDPASKKEVVFHENTWKTIEGYEKNGQPIYGQVSGEFKDKSQPILDKMIESTTGTALYERMRDLSTRVIIDQTNELNLKKIEEKDLNGVQHSTEGDPATGQLYEEVVVTFNLGGIKKRAEEDGISEEEKFIQVVSVELGHFETAGQISNELRYSNPDNAKEFKWMYELLVNEAIREGLNYREEKKIPASPTSFIPFTKLKQHEYGGKLELDEGNQQVYDEVTKN